ncbi:hypothetical protein L3Q82_007060 [Scortum barcoo]|uniref:Uncharacterized protein n=1 Tax=Scortum barcoo TaxID=214431 RepID=A0ACB8WXL8_9TELE|nr:hypothetical protein L3Q82_007060 [Scortum barcoo]
MMFMMMMMIKGDDDDDDDEDDVHDEDDDDVHDDDDLCVLLQSVTVTWSAVFLLTVWTLASVHVNPELQDAAVTLVYLDTPGEEAEPAAQSLMVEGGAAAVPGNGDAASQDPLYGSPVEAAEDP